jgi:acyl-coenzyme A thioesterase PaaI-like protein
MTTLDWANALRASGRGERIDSLPYAAKLGVLADHDGSDFKLVMPFQDSLIGSPGRLHGGAIAGLLELSALAAVLLALPEDETLPGLKPVTVTVDFMREGALRDTFAAGTITRLGRRIANVRAVAWQYDYSRPIAAANINFVLDRP